MKVSRLILGGIKRVYVHFQQYINAILSVCSVKPRVWRVTLSCKRHKTDIRCPVILRRKPDYISDSETHDTDDGQSTSPRSHAWAHRPRRAGGSNRQRADGADDVDADLRLFAVCRAAAVQTGLARRAQPLPIAASAPALALGMDVQQRVGYRIDAQGAGQFIALRRHRTASPAPLAQQTLLAKPALLARPPESAICSRWRRPTAGWWWRARILRRRKTAGRSGCSRSGSSRWRWIRSASR